MGVTKPWIHPLLAAAALMLLSARCGSSPTASHGTGGAVGGGSANQTGGTGATTGGITAGAGAGGAGSTGGLAAGGGGGSAGGPTGGSTETRDGALVGGDASPDVAAATEGGRSGGASGRGGSSGSGGSAGGSTGGAAGGSAGSNAAGGSTTGRDGGPSTGGISGTGGTVATGGEAGSASACAANEVSKCTSGDGPLGGEIKCDFGGSDGNYDVTVELGGATDGDTFIDAEMYRRMLPELTTMAGHSQRFNFTVNVRTPEGQPVEVGNTDSVPGLQVYFRGPNPKVSVICHQAASKPLMLWIGGDSTVCDQDSTNYTGWGQRLPQFMQGTVSIANYADSGESSGSFLNSSAMFGAIKSRWKAGDWFFIQMGHNDKTTTAATFLSNMTSYATQAKAAGVNIVLITPISRVGYKLAEEHVNSTGANLPQIIRDLGTSQNVPVIDLTATTWNWIQTIAPKDYFAADSSVSGGYDHTHLGPKGADVVAGFVRDAIKANPGIPALLPHLR